MPDRPVRLTRHADHDPSLTCRPALGYGLCEVLKPVCPECGAGVIYDLTCHTYGQGDRFYACLPCDSAVEYICVRELDDNGECGWRYTHGLNPANPRASANESRRPPWLPEGQGCEGGEWVVPGVSLIGTGELS